MELPEGLLKRTLRSFFGGSASLGARRYLRNRMGHAMMAKQADESVRKRKVIRLSFMYAIYKEESS